MCLRVEYLQELLEDKLLLIKEIIHYNYYLCGVIIIINHLLGQSLMTHDFNENERKSSEGILRKSNPFFKEDLLEWNFKTLEIFIRIIIILSHYIIILYIIIINM